VTAFQHREFLDVAVYIEGAAPAPPDGFFRTAVSRAYYFAFLESREQCKRHQILKVKLSKTRIEQRDVIQALQHSKNPALVNIGQRLAAFQTERERADYELSGRIQAADATGAIDQARQIQNKWSAYTPRKAPPA
jgi:hypothetical protein